MQTYVSFPGLGIGEMTINKVAFTLPIGEGLAIHWYAIIILIGILAGLGYALLRADCVKIPRGDIVDFAILTIPMALVGARIYYVLTTLKKGRYESIGDLFNIRNGGLAIYGAVIGGALAIFIVAKLKKYDKSKMLRVFDAVTPGVMLGQIIGRVANFINGEAHGIRVGEDFFLRMGLAGSAGGRVTFYHPTFLYEMLWNILGFVLINVFYKKRKFDGQILLAYLGFYGFGRMLIEGIRSDSLYVGAFRISQVIGFLCFVICTVLMALILMKEKRRVKDAESYVPLYERSHRSVTKRAGDERRRIEEDAKADIDAIIAHAEEARAQKSEDEENEQAD